MLQGDLDPHVQWIYVDDILGEGFNQIDHEDGALFLAFDLLR